MALPLRSGVKCHRRKLGGGYEDRQPRDPARPPARSAAIPRKPRPAGPCSSGLKGGKPDSAAQPAFADITDAEQAKAAQWCVEQGLLDAREGKFESDGWMPKFKTIEIWNKAFPQK